MSEKKTIQINPDLFSFPSTNKTRKKRNHPDEPNKPIKIKTATKPVSSKTVKNRLLKYIRQQQDANYKRLSATNNPTANPSAMITTEPAFESDFENSLKYLSSIAEKTQQSIPTEYKKGHHSTLRQLPPTTGSLLYGSTLNSVGLHTGVGIDLPNVFDAVSPSSNTEKSLFLRNTSASVPKFGCLKNGVLPTYRMWKNQTLRTHGGNTANSRERSSTEFPRTPSAHQGACVSSRPEYFAGSPHTSTQTPYRGSSFSPNVVSSANTNTTLSNSFALRSPELLHIPSGSRPEYLPNAIPPMTFRTPDTFIPQNTVLRNPSPVLGRHLPLSTLGGKPSQIAEMEKHHQHRKNSLQLRPKHLFRKLKQKRTVRRTYRVGKSKHYPNVSVLVSNKTLRKQITTKSQLLKQIPMEEVKKTLIKKGFIKVGCSAPSDVLRKMYETVSLVCGEVQNHNPENLLYNYLHGGET